MEVVSSEVKPFNSVVGDIQLFRYNIVNHEDIDALKDRILLTKAIGFEAVSVKLQKKLDHILFAKEKYVELDKAYPDQEIIYILPDQLEELCCKYNFYVRKAEYYIGEIPDDAIEKIKKFVVDDSFTYPMIVSIRGNLNAQAFRNHDLRLEGNNSQEYPKYQAEDGAFAILSWKGGYIIPALWSTKDISTIGLFATIDFPLAAECLKTLDLCNLSKSD